MRVLRVARLGIIGGRRVTQHPGGRSLSGAVALGDLGAIAVLVDELLLGEEVVGEPVVELPHLAQQVELGGGVEAEVAPSSSRTRVQCCCST